MLIEVGFFVIQGKNLGIFMPHPVPVLGTSFPYFGPT